MSSRTQNTGRQTGAARRRAEKLSALSELLGPEAMERLRRRDEGFREPAAALSSASEERVAWQRNRLIERLRGQWPDEAGAVEVNGGAATVWGTRRAGLDASVSVDTRIAGAVDLATLAHEHPAVIVRVLERMDREERVVALRGLPGPTARAAIHRLRSR